jgi:hypothetical protein
LRPCIESRHACQALKSLATHKSDRNDARGLAHLACTGGSSVHVVCGATLGFTVAGAYAWEHSCSGAGVYDTTLACAGQHLALATKEMSQ